MNILITGVNGLIGKAVAKELSKNNTVIGISRSIANKTELSIEYHSVDISKLNFIDLFEETQIDLIVHCAASLDSDALSEDLIASNCMGVRNIAKLAITHKCKQVIYISSIPIIGKPKQIPITEEHPVNPKAVYYLTKYFGELYLSSVLGEKLNLTILRLPSPIGFDLIENKIIPSFIKKCLMNEDIMLLGKGGRVQNYVDVKDIAVAINLAIQNKVSGTYNIAAEKSYSNREVAEICIKLFNSSSKIIYNGIDQEEENKWIISIEKARNYFRYEPMISLEDSVIEISKRYAL